MNTRIFRRHPKEQSPYFISVQVSFTDQKSAERFAKKIDRIKAAAATSGVSFSKKLLEHITA